MSVAGDVFVTVSLAGTLFFDVGVGAARPKVLLYLILTMAPFAVIAPVIGPFLDRTRGGRRLMVVISMLGRGLVCIFMARHVDGLLLYPLAFAALVLWSAFFVFLIQSPRAEPTEAPARASILGEALAGFRAIGGDSRLRILVGLITCATLAIISAWPGLLGTWALEKCDATRLRTDLALPTYVTRPPASRNRYTPGWSGSARRCSARLAPCSAPSVSATLPSTHPRIGGLARGQ